jgi:hypothetical protein
MEAVMAHRILMGPNNVVIVAVAGLRSPEEAEACGEDFLRFYSEHPTGLVLFDTTLARSTASPERMFHWTFSLARACPTTRAAVIARAPDCAFARLWRRALTEAGHEAAMFRNADEAEAWLLSPVEADTLYVS